MKYGLMLTIMLISICTVNAQDIAVLMKVAQNYERDLKEPEALDAYKQVLTNDPKNIKALVKTAELSCSIGARLYNNTDKRLQYESGMSFAKRAFAVDSNNADANYAIAMVSGKMIEIETDNKKKVAYVRDAKLFADRALAINPKHAKATFIEGRWHYEMVTLNSLKRTAAKFLYGGLPEASLDSAIFYLEKSKQLNPYAVITSYYLDKAYKEDNKPAKQLELLNRLVKLPTRYFDDIKMKEEATNELASLQ